ncbi:mechanosensitive ion channel family protein [Psychromonas antarctica]|uniref:mechanosensitive ion channel family protein n=1 Tax=Psychromonas antarctica TaxID=67573 RepID=UPI001EE9A1A5|nr:mechanosensitive ion channel domain-containing protein [Psychromonas antarctica]MCG6202499.1 mechanosensitive ion channel [Psychromonas antarctica]
MTLITTIKETVIDFIPLVLTAIIVALILTAAHRLLIKNKAELGSERMFTRQLFMLVVSIIGALAIVLALPVAESARNQIIGLIGLLISGVFALSSTNVFSNLAAGILLRVTKPFAIGDFIYVQDYFGRVSERGLFDTELQSESGEFIAIPNTYLVSCPVKTVRSASTIVSASLTLGYDLHHKNIEPLLITAAEESGLKESFVHILELGNFSITYRVSGVLAESNKLISARSNLYKHILDTLHNNNIEIVSPSFMNQRPMNPGVAVIPPSPIEQVSLAEVAEAEQVLFAKAEQAEKVEQEKKVLVDKINELEVRRKETQDIEKEFTEATLKQAKISLEKLNKVIDDVIDKTADKEIDKEVDKE